MFVKNLLQVLVWDVQLHVYYHVMKCVQKIVLVIVDQEYVVDVREHVKADAMEPVLKIVHLLSCLNDGLY